MIRKKRNFLAKNNLYTIFGVVITVAIALSAVAVSLFQQWKSGPLAPTAPGSEPSASTFTSETCTLTFDVVAPTATPVEPTATPADICLTEADIVLVLDRSGSMNELESDGRTKLEWEKEAAISFVQTVAATQNTNINIGVVSFGAQGNDGTGKLDHLYDTTLNSPLSQNYDQVISDISQIVYIPFTAPDSIAETCISCGLGIGTKELIDNATTPSRAVILLSDGKANRTWAGNAGNAAAIAEAIQAANYGRNNDVSYHVLGYGLVSNNQIDEGTLKQIAGVPEYYQYKPNVGDWESAFLAVFDQLCLPLSPTPTAVNPTNTPTATPGSGGPSATPTPRPSADLSVIKTVDEVAPIVGENITYTITVTNNGPDTATGVVVGDTITPPTGLDIISHTASQGTFNETTGIWTVGTIAPNNSATLTITAKVLTAGSIKNLADVRESDQEDPDSTPGNTTPDNPNDNEDDEDETVITPVSPSPTPTNTPTPSNTPAPTATNTPVPTNTPTNTSTPSNTPTPSSTLTPTPTDSPTCVTPQSQDVTASCVTCPTCTSEIIWKWTPATSSITSEYKVDIYNSQNELIQSSDWQSAVSFFNCTSGTCSYSTTHSIGSYYAIINTRLTGAPENICFNPETTTTVSIELCSQSSITPTGLPNAGSTGPTVLLFGVGAVAIILGILGFIFIF